MAQVHLRHRQYEGLVFGPHGDIADNIAFGVKGGNLPGEWVGDDSHPLYKALWDAEGPNLEVVDDTGPARVYVSPLDPEREFKSRPALLSHIRAVARGKSELAPMAKAWLDHNAADVEDDAEADAET